MALRNVALHHRLTPLETSESTLPKQVHKFRLHCVSYLPNILSNPKTENNKLVLYGPGYLKTVCDYGHLNLARAKLLEPTQALRAYRWSSRPEFLERSGKRWPQKGQSEKTGNTSVPHNRTFPLTALRSPSAR